MKEPCEQAKQPDHYEIHKQGPLTYYCCYFDDFAPGLNSTLLEKPSTSTHPFASKSALVGIVGAGLAVTAVTGFAIAHNNEQATQPTPKQQASKSQFNQTEMKPQLGFKPSAPETIDKQPLTSTRAASTRTNKSYSQTQFNLRQSSKTSNVKSKAFPKAQTSISLERKPQAVSAPEMLPLPQITLSNLSTQNKARLRATTSTPSVPKTVSAPVKVATSPSINKSLPNSNSSLAPSPVQVKQQISLAYQQPTPLKLAEVQSGPSQAAVEAVNASMKMKALSSEADNLSSASSSKTENTPQPASTPIASPKSLPDTAPKAVSSNKFQLPSKLQDFLTFPQQNARASAITLLPLTDQAAKELQGSQQIAQFTVRNLAPQDYQQEWLISSKIPEAAEASSSLPTYGFIDYQRKVIVLLQGSSNTQPLQAETSQRPTPPS